MWGDVTVLWCPDPFSFYPQCDTLQLCEENELLLVRQDLDIAQVPLEQCHKRTFQAVSAASPPLP